MTNVFRIYPGWTCWAWLIWCTVVLSSFAVIEYLGLRRIHGAIPLTWFIRDSLPQLARWMFACWLLYHFGVETNTGQPLH